MPVGPCPLPRRLYRARRSCPRGVIRIQMLFLRALRAARLAHRDRRDYKMLDDFYAVNFIAVIPG